MTDHSSPENADMAALIEKLTAERDDALAKGAALFYMIPEDIAANIKMGDVQAKWKELLRIPAQCAPNRIDKGRAFYLAMYEKDGAIWAANDHKDLWCDMAEDYERRISALTSPERQVDPTRPACGQGDEHGRKPTEQRYGHD